MLSEKLIPTPLIRKGEEPPIVIDNKPPRIRFRIAYLGIHVLWLSARILGLHVLGRLTHDRLGSLLREFCQRMGMIWIKVGQLLSMRADLAPPGVRDQLARLLDRVQGFAPAQAACDGFKAGPDGESTLRSYGGGNDSKDEPGTVIRFI